MSADELGTLTTEVLWSLTKSARVSEIIRLWSLVLSAGQIRC